MGDDEEPEKQASLDKSALSEAEAPVKADANGATAANEGSEDDFHSAMEVEEASDSKGVDDDEESLEDNNTEIPEDEDEISIKSHATTEQDAASVASHHKTKDDSVTRKTPKGKRPAKAAAGSSVKKGRAPSVAGLTIPFRTVKKAMKLEPETPIVQNEAAIMTTFAVELFLKRLAKDSFRNAKNRGRNTVRYEDVAEARTNDKALSFLEPLLP